jgi:hypothetical protein
MLRVWPHLHFPEDIARFLILVELIFSFCSAHKHRFLCCQSAVLLLLKQSEKRCGKSKTASSGNQSVLERQFIFNNAAFFVAHV